MELNTNNSYEQEKLPPLLKVTCYSVALVFTSLILYIFTGFIATSINTIFDVDTEVNFIQVIFWISTVYTVLRLSVKLGDYWRQSGSEIGTGVTNIPNLFRDPSFKKGPVKLKFEYSKLYAQYKKVIKSTSELEEKYEAVQEQHQKFLKRLIVMLRHHDNASRLIQSFVYALQSERYSLDRVLKDTLSECITVLERDQSDKSISLFEVQGEHLTIIDGVRINAESVVNRKFLIGEGFAGWVWNEGHPSYENRIDYENDIRFKHNSKVGRPRYKSILGIPLINNQDIIGVLCIQSEQHNGFCDEDMRALEFYGHLCTLIMSYAKIKEER